MSILTGTCYDEKADKIWKSSRGGNGSCYIIKLGDKLRILKKLFNRSGRRIDDLFDNALKFQIPLSPMFFDNSQNHPGEISNWILTDYIPGNTLTAFMAGGYVGMRIKKRYTLEILAGITFQLSIMKHKHIKHRDLKPDNIIIDADMIPHLIDWDDATDRFSLSRSKNHGTVPFTAPEVFLSERRCESDIFSFGSIMYSIITEAFPFSQAYTTRKGLSVLLSQRPEFDRPDLEETLAMLDDFEMMSQSERADSWNIIVTQVEPILVELIKLGIRDDSIFYNEQFMSDPFNNKIARLIRLCWKQDYQERIDPDELQDEIDKIAKEILTEPQDLMHYNNYCECIFSLEPHEYGTLEMIEKAKKIGMYENDAPLLEIIKYYDPSFEMESDSKFSLFLQSLAPNS